MAALSETPLVFRGATLQRHLIGPALPHTALVVEVLGIPEGEDLPSLAGTVAQLLFPFVQVHDIWAEIHTTAGIAEPTNYEK